MPADPRAPECAFGIDRSTGDRDIGAADTAVPCFTACGVTALRNDRSAADGNVAASGGGAASDPCAAIELISDVFKISFF